MSKGYGKLQRAILDVFESDPDKLLDTITIGVRAYGVNPISRAQASSVRRALRKLVDAGEVVDLGRSWRQARRHFALPSTAAAYRKRYQDTFGQRAPQ
ncbi:hypothetical protein [Ponticaulis profundi]|uniref:Uncharacterized protein n=1 Tax=Ponticaulis profundi TaxID=2665222 RepID=A0ABW1SC50_9PROT